MDARIFLNSQFLNATDFADEPRQSARIVNVTSEVIGTDEKLVLALNGLGARRWQKKLALNATNNRTMISAFGANTDRWVEQTLDLFTVPTTMGPGVRVAPVAAAAAATPAAGRGKTVRTGAKTAAGGGGGGGDSDLDDEIPFVTGDPAAEPCLKHGNVV